MSASIENVKHDMQKDPATLEQEADRARSDLEHTLEALERRFSPGEMLNQAIWVIREQGGGFAGNLATQVRNNPVAAVVAGIGMTWLMAASRQPPQRRATHGMGSSVGERAASTAASARDAAGHAAGGARSAAHATGETARHAAGSVVDATRSSLGSVAHASRSGAEALRDGYGYLHREQPLVLGALAVAAGAAIGALMRSTEVEDELMGEPSDRVRGRLEEEGRRGVDSVKARTADAAEAGAQAAGAQHPHRSHEPPGGGSADRPEV